jgi:quercetin dioxygenase-like cupin family protein
MWEQDLAKGAMLEAPRSETDLLGVVLAGTVTVDDTEKPSASEPLGPWHAFRAPGGGVQLKAGDSDARVVLVVATTGGPLAAEIDKYAAHWKEGAWKTRPAPIARADLGAAKDLGWGAGAYHARIAFEAESSPHASLGVLLLSADAPVPEHTHPNEWEYLAMLRGAGTFEQAGNPSEAHAGSIFVVSPGTKHAWKPSGDEPVVGIQCYTPPGPEQRFKKLAAGG